MKPRPVQKFSGNATWRLALALSAAVATQGGCGSAPPAAPKQVQEYARHTSVGLEKYRDGMLGEARNAFLRALARAELDDDATLISSALLNLGAAELLLDHPDAASHAYTRASREARLARSPRLEWQALSGLAEATRRSGQPAKALEILAARPPADKELPAAIRLPAEISRARALADSGQGATALALIEQLIASAQALPQPDPALATAFHARAAILLASGDADAAREPAGRALELDRALHHPPSVAADHQLLGRIAAAQNNDAAAQHHAQRALAIYANTGQEKRAGEARAALKKGQAGQ